MRISKLWSRSGSDSTDQDHLEEESLRKDESGAMMVIGLFMAVFLVGMLYYIVGLGDAIAYRERMQDTSDVGSFTHAVVNARGMNLIVLLNMVMAAIMAILLSLKVMEIVITVAMGIAAAVGALCFGCTAPAVAFLNTLRTVVGRVADGFERIAKPLITAISVAQKAIKFAWPAVGQGRAIYGMLGDNGVSGSPSTGGIVFPIYAALPVEDHVFRETCDRGAQLAVRLIKKPFEAIPIIGGKVADWIGSGARAIYDGYSAYFCGGPPADDVPSYTVERAKPSTPESQACETQCQPAIAGCSAAGCDNISAESCQRYLNQVCHESTQQQAIFGPAYCHPEQIDLNATTHEGDAWCQGGNVHTWQGCYDENRGTDTGTRVYEGDQTGDDSGRLTQGRRVQPSEIQTGCMDRNQRATNECDGGRKVTWDEETRYVVYFSIITGGVCRVGSSAVNPQELDNRLRAWSSGGPSNASTACRSRMRWYPGGGTGTHPFPASCDYDLAPNWEDTAPSTVGLVGGDLQLACNALPASYNEARDALLAGTLSSQYQRSVRVRLINGCITDDRLEIDVAVGETAADSGGWDPPQRVCEHTGRGAIGSVFSTGCADSGDDIYHGAEEFQLRSVVAAPQQSSNADQGTRVATWSGPGQRGMRGVSIPDPREHIFIWGAAHRLGQLSMSQSEYFWDQREDCNDTETAPHCRGYINEHNDQREWMWDMAWTARMRRIHFSSIGGAQEAARGAGSIGSRIVGWIDSVFIH